MTLPDAPADPQGTKRVRLATDRVTRRDVLIRSAAWGSLLATGCSRGAKSISLACAAGWRSPVEQLVNLFRQEAGITVRTIFDGTGRLVASVNAGLNVDLILAADASFLDRLSVDGFLPARTIRRQQVRLVTQPSPDSPTTWDDVLRGAVRLSLPHETTAAVGHAVKRTLDHDTWKRLEQAAVVRRTTVTESAADVAVLGVADATFIWDTTWPTDTRLAPVAVPELRDATGEVALAVARDASQHATALANRLVYDLAK